MRGQHQQGIEPTPGLVDTLAHEIRGVAFLKPLLVLKRKVRLGIWHTARLEPAVKHLFDPLEVALALLGGNDDLVDTLPVQVFDALDARELLELRDRANADNLRQLVLFTLTSCMSSLAQRGIGVPQYLFLEIFQSRAFFSHPPNLPSPMFAGTLNSACP
jgi:hypothetical protein